MDAGQLLDGGRLAAEGPAPARHHWSTDPTGDGTDDGPDDKFGFATIVRLSGTHLQR